MAEYPAGSNLAAMQYIKKGMPELIMPRTSVDQNIPLNVHLVPNNASINSNPPAPNKTLKKAVGKAPKTGAAILINKKLAPHIAASSNNLP